MKKTGIITALKAEAACLTADTMLPNEPIEIAPGILLVLAGIGPARAGQAAEQLIAAGADGLISFGTAGGLDRAIRPGALCVPRKIITTDAAALETDRRWHADMRRLLRDAPVKLHSAPLFSSERLLAATDEKALINRQSGAIAIDMESAAIVKAANRQRLPCLVLRAVVDPADMPLPVGALRHVDHLGHAKLLPLLKYLLAHPEHILPMMKLAACFKAAAATLTWAARQITAN